MKVQSVVKMLEMKMKLGLEQRTAGLLSLLFLVVTGLSSTSVALDMGRMTPVKSTYTSDKLKTITGQIKCGRFKVCSGDVSCTYVDNDVLAKEYGGDLRKAEEQAWQGALLGKGIVRVGVVAWSEFSGQNPHFIDAFSPVHCAGHDGKCPSARDCVLDNKNVTIGDEPAKEIKNHIRPSTLEGATQ